MSGVREQFREMKRPLVFMGSVALSTPLLYIDKTELLLGILTAVCSGAVGKCADWVAEGSKPRKRQSPPPGDDLIGAGR